MRKKNAAEWSLGTYGVTIRTWSLSDCFVAKYDSKLSGILLPHSTCLESVGSLKIWLQLSNFKMHYQRVELLDDIVERGTPTDLLKELKIKQPKVTYTVVRLPQSTYSSESGLPSLSVAANVTTPCRVETTKSHRLG